MGAKKKYYGYKKPEKHYTITINDDIGKSIGTLLFINYDNGEFSMVKVNWGADDDYERSRNGEVEMNWYFDEENTKKLMLRTGTHNGKDMLRALHELFKEKADMADSYITKFCDEKEIKYTYNVFY